LYLYLGESEAVETCSLLCGKSTNLLKFPFYFSIIKMLKRSREKINQI